jgi:uncharacterized protein (TIGR02646 family)
MIQRARPTDSCPQSLRPARLDSAGVEQPPFSPGAKELAKVKAWFTARNRVPPPKRPAFAAYGGNDVKKALETIFEGKCAYCESRYVAQQPVDVEHWRPKARVHGEAEEAGGYEWLAMAWENLLPSCIDCNRERKHPIPDPDRPGHTKDIFLGKADHFPLDPASTRWRFGQPNREKPLLIDPCTEDPAMFFDFPARGPDAGVVLPKQGLSAGDFLRATESIRIYALNRKNLVEERRRHLLRLELTFRLIRLLFQLSGDPALPESRRPAVEAAVAVALAELKESADPKAPYSQFMNRRIREFVEVELGIT